MSLSMWTYPWDVLDLGHDRVIGELAGVGLDTISLATSYHAGRFLQPRSPRRKAYFPEDGTIYFKPTPGRWGDQKIQPKLADVIAEGGDALRELIRRRDAGGLKVNAWTVCLHNTRLGMLHPEAVTRNAFGDPNYYNLCPSNADARAYLRTLVADLTESYRPDVVELESPGFMGFAHEYHHEKDAVGLTPEDDFLMSLCFCPSCLERARKAGMDGEAAQATVRRLIIEAIEREVPQPRWPAFPTSGFSVFENIPEIYDYLRWRQEPVISLIADLRAVAHQDCRVHLVDLKDGLLAGCDVADVGKVCDGVMLCAYAMEPEAVGALLFAGRRALGADKFLGAGFRLVYPELKSATDLVGRVGATLPSQPDGLSFYNYGLIPAARLGWVREVVARYQTPR